MRTSAGNCGQRHRRRPAAPRAAFELRRGRFSLAGRTLDFTEGSIGFNGGSITDPALHLVATSTSGNVTATLTIGGHRAEPEDHAEQRARRCRRTRSWRSCCSAPAAASLGALEVAQIAAGLATLTGAGGGVGDPLANLRQGAGAGPAVGRQQRQRQPDVQAGRYIAPGVYLGAKQSASGGGTQATVQIDIAKGLKLETTTGTGGGIRDRRRGDNGSSVGLTYQFEY